MEENNYRLGRLTTANFNTDYIKKCLPFMQTFVKNIVRADVLTHGFFPDSRDLFSSLKRLCGTGVT